MSDEAAMLLRVSAFGFVAGVVYWFLSYEWLGTVALLLLGAGPGFAGLILIQEQRHQGGMAESRTATLLRFAGIPPADPPGPGNLAAGDLGVLPLPTIWPFAAGLGVAVLLTGLIYGLWLVVLGAGICAYATWGWLATVNRENRYGRVMAEQEEPASTADPPQPAAPPDGSEPADP